MGNYLQPAGALEIAAANTHTWGVLAAWLAPYLGPHGDPTNIVTAFNVLLSAAIFFAVAGAFLRTWGTAYLSTGVVESGAMHIATASAGGIVEDGPFRHLRNPLYLGTFLHAVALSLLMSRSGAIFTIVDRDSACFSCGLSLAKRRFSRALWVRRIRHTARGCRACCPRCGRKIAAAGREPRWFQAFAGEFYFWGVALSFAFLGWAYATPRLIQAIVISFGLALLIRAFTPRPVAA